MNLHRVECAVKVPGKHLETTVTSWIHQQSSSITLAGTSALSDCDKLPRPLLSWPSFTPTSLSQTHRASEHNSLDTSVRHWPTGLEIKGTFTKAWVAYQVKAPCIQCIHQGIWRGAGGPFSIQIALTSVELMFRNKMFGSSTSLHKQI